MNPRRVLLAAAAATFSSLAIIPPSIAIAAEPIAPPVMYPATLWQGHGQAIVRVLDRMDSHVTLLTIPVDGVGQYKTLRIALHRCVDRPPTLAPDAAIQASITDSTDTNAHFDGWMLAAEPAISVFPSPLYAVRVLSCAGDITAPAVPPLSPAQIPPVVATDPTGAQDQPGDVGDQSSTTATTPQARNPDTNASTNKPTSPPVNPMNGTAQTLVAPVATHANNAPPPPATGHMAPANIAPPAGGPMQLAPESEPEATPSAPNGGPMPLAPPSEAEPTTPSAGSSPQHLPPPQPFPDQH